jgi:hypothetical protein
LFEPIEVKPFDHENFAAAPSIAPIGPLSVVRTSSSAASIERSDRYVGAADERLAFLMESYAPSRTTFTTYNRAEVR